MLQPTQNYAFIDENNLHMAVRDLGWRVDYRRFRVFLRERYRVEKAAGGMIAFVDPLRAKLEFTEQKSTR